MEDYLPYISYTSFVKMAGKGSLFEMNPPIATTISSYNAMTIKLAVF